MSGSIFGNVAPVQVPDFGQTLARAQGMQANRLAMLAQQRQMDERDRLTQFFQQHGSGFAAADPRQQLNLLAMMAQTGMPGAQLAFPQMQAARDALEWSGGGAPAPAVTGTPAAAPAGAANQRWDDRSLPRGLRNNNPLNLSYVEGQPGVQGSDGRFGRYQSMEDGIAAATRQLQIYGQRGLTTVEQIVGRWAPPNENNTPAYVAAVARELGIDPRAPLNLSDPMLVSRLVGAMGRIEVGRPLDPSVVARGVQRALGGDSSPASRGGDTIPAQAGGQPPAPGAPSAPSGLPAVPGFDMDRVQRAINLPNNPAAQRYLQAYMQAAGVMRREAEPLEIVEGPDGQPTMVPRSQAVGRRPANRDMAPRSQERFEQDRQIAEASAARSQTTVNAGDRRTDVLVADAWNTAEENARDAGRRNVLFRRAEAAMQGFQPGILAERRLWLGQMARELGIRTPGTTEGEVLQQVQRQLELAATPRGQGAITENERGLVREAVPLLLRSPEGARAAIALLRQLDDYEMQIARIYRENARRHGGQPDPASVREEIAAFVAQNQPPDVHAVLDSYTSPPQQGAATGIQADPPAGPTIRRYNPRTGRIE